MYIYIRPWGTIRFGDNHYQKLQFEPYTITNDLTTTVACLYIRYLKN